MLRARAMSVLGLAQEGGGLIANVQGLGMIRRRRQHVVGVPLGVTVLLCLQALLR